VCKHYLRNLCKIGDNCEYTHDFNLRTMPVCVFFVKTGKCELGGECLYFHPRDRRVECPDYNRGFCRLGELCPAGCLPLLLLDVKTLGSPLERLIAD
jgi:cleavage and polyadenylation specificity factor subunit 4